MEQTIQKIHIDSQTQRPTGYVKVCGWGHGRGQGEQESQCPLEVLSLSSHVGMRTLNFQIL